MTTFNTVIPWYVKQMGCVTRAVVIGLSVRVAEDASVGADDEAADPGLPSCWDGRQRSGAGAEVTAIVPL